MTTRVAVCTGGTGALGHATAQRLLAVGETVCIPYLVPAEVEHLRATIPAERLTRLHTEQVDVTDEGAFNAFVGRILAQYSRLDALINIIGAYAPGELAFTTVAEWKRMMDLNLTSAVIACRGVLPCMTSARHGRIVNVTSRAALSPSPGSIAYTVSKAAVVTLTQVLALEVRAHGITVNAVAPSTMDTPGNRAAMPNANWSEWVSSDAVAAIIAFLVSEDAGGVTGAVIPV